jgi:hypothetical protein
MHTQRKEAAALLQRFVEGDVEDWEFDDFVSSRSDDPGLEAYRFEVARIPILFPPEVSTHYTSEEGISRILEISRALAHSVGQPE